MTTPQDGTPAEEPLGDDGQSGHVEPSDSQPPPPPSPPTYPPPPPPPSAYPPPPDGFPGATPGVYAEAAGAIGTPKQNGKAIASLVLGILGFCICGIILGAVAVFLGLQARKEIAASNGTQGGDGLALAGLIVGGIAVVLGFGQLIYVLGR